jgi:coenzyme F420-reducing hydrogenase beta subunit
MGDCFIDVRNDLKSGRRVLFTGTPCQVDALNAFLSLVSVGTDGLITADIICHGVPSPMVWEKYIAYQKDKMGQEIVQASFRDKSSGWKRYSIKLQAKNGEIYRETLQKDLYLIAFLKNLSLRPSCYHCSFKSIERSADITLADFWGVEKVCPNMETKQGVSLVLIHTLQGRSLFDKISENLTFQGVDLQESIKGNSSINTSVIEPKKRKKFIKTIRRKDFLSIQRYCKKSFVEKVLDLLRRIKYRFFRRK